MFGVGLPGGETGLERKFVQEGLHFGAPLFGKSRRIFPLFAHEKECDFCL